MTHDEFVSRLGPILAPENYENIPSSPPPHVSSSPSSPPAPPLHPHLHTRTRSTSGHPHHLHTTSPNHTPTPYTYTLPGPGMPPFDWMHFEARAVPATLSNMTGIDGLARERGWRSRCIFSLSISRAGVETVSCQIMVPHVILQCSAERVR